MMVLQRWTFAAACVVIAMAYALSPVTIERSAPAGPTFQLSPIIYGLPAPELLERAGRHEVWFGGCVIGPAAPRWIMLI